MRDCRMHSFCFKYRSDAGCREHSYEGRCCIVLVFYRKILKLVRALNKLFILRSILTFSELADMSCT